MENFKFGSFPILDVYLCVGGCVLVCVYMCVLYIMFYLDNSCIVVKYLELTRRQLIKRQDSSIVYLW